MVLSRRDFIKWSAGAGAWMYVSGIAGSSFLSKAGAVPLPGGTLDPLTIPKYRTPMLIPPVMPRAGLITLPNGRVADYYKISVKQFAQQILPPTMPASTVWGYGATSSMTPYGLLLHNAPSLTIEALVHRPVMVKWINDLRDGSGNFRPHLLPVDQTLHWANPPGGIAGRDSRPDWSASGTPAAYTGPVPICTHVHGAVGVGDESDGYAEAWYLPNANDIPAGYATEGTWYDFFKGKARDMHDACWGPGFATFVYPNDNRASTIWYHDHALGMTRTNVYAGPAGFYLVRGGTAGDRSVRDRRNGRVAILPGPAPRATDPLSPPHPYHEIPIAIQDRAFNSDGSLFYPDSREFFDGYTGPFIPTTDVSPIWNPEFFGNTMMVNGNTWPYLTVERRRYRFRFLNGCQSRFLILDFAAIPGVKVWQIGNEGGFLPAPVNINVHHNNRLLMGLAERADLVVDFTDVPNGNYVLRNVGPDEPFGGGVPGTDFPMSDAGTTGQIMQFRVRARRSPDRTTPPQFLRLPPIRPLPMETVTRRLSMVEVMSTSAPGPAEARLGTVDGDPNTGPVPYTGKMWMEPVTENPAVGATEVWELYNTTADAHPMHVHEVVFEVVNRQQITVDDVNGTVEMGPGAARPPRPWERGFKDTVTAFPGEVTRIRMKFNKPGQFVWHCHIVEHEDNEMMRPYRIGPVQPGQP